jgi:hypothetical protein
VSLQDETGNVFTYANLGSVPSSYPVPKPVAVSAAQIARELSLPAPSAPATAGQQQPPGVPSQGQASKETRSAPVSLPVTPAPASTPQPAQSAQSADSGSSPAMVKERLFADPSRPASYAAGGALQIKSSQQQISSFQNYFSDVLHLDRNQYSLAPLRAGARVVAGTILGRIAAPAQGKASHLLFMIRPAGKGAPYIDPKPILDGWKLLEATAVYRAEGINPFTKKDPTIGQILLMSKEQLQFRVLADPHAHIYACGRRDIQASLIDRRILAVIEFLSASGLDPTVSGLVCGQDKTSSSGTSMQISKINNIPIQGHQNKGSITDQTIRRLLTLQGTFKPDQIISTLTYKNQPNTINQPDHQTNIQITYTPQYGPNQKLSNQLKAILQPGQWTQLINRISQIPEPIVPIAPSKYAIKARG